MNKGILYQDIAWFFFALPFVVPAIYGLYLWYRSGFSAFLPQDVYISVTTDPNVFLVGIMSIILAAYFDLISVKVEEREKKIESIASTLQKIGVTSFLLSVIVSLYSSHFYDLGTLATEIVVGRYDIIFPAFTFIFGFLLVIPIRREYLSRASVISFILLLIIPVIIYVGGRRLPIASFVLSFALIIVSVSLIIYDKSVKRIESTSKDSN